MRVKYIRTDKGLRRVSILKQVDDGERRKMSWVNQPEPVLPDDCFPKRPMQNERSVSLRANFGVG